MQVDRERVFIESMEAGRQKLIAASEKLDVIGRALANFGQALSEFSEGKVGIACVTMDDGLGLADDFIVGKPLNIVLVSFVDPDLPKPIVAQMEISPYGFPARISIDGVSQSALDEDGMIRLLNEMAASSTFALAVRDLMVMDKPPRHLLS